MARYIDTQKVTVPSGFFNKNLGVPDLLKWLEAQPTADVVPIVRCKDCQNCEVIYPVKIIGEEPEEVYYCKAHNGSRNPKDFCSYGRRKDEISKATDS